MGVILTFLFVKVYNAFLVIQILATDAVTNL